MIFLRLTVRIFILYFFLLQKPDRDEWGTGLDAMQVALQLEKTVNQSLLDLHKVADSHKDAQVKHVVSVLLNVLSNKRSY